MNKMEWIAPCHFGLESVLKREIQDLGYEISQVEDGRVTFYGLLLFRLARRLWGQDLRFLFLQRLDAVLCCSDLRIILCHNRLFLRLPPFDGLI